MKHFSITFVFSGNLCPTRNFRSIPFRRSAPLLKKANQKSLDTDPLGDDTKCVRCKEAHRQSQNHGYVIVGCKCNTMAYVRRRVPWHSCNVAHPDLVVKRRRGHHAYPPWETAATAMEARCGVQLVVYNLCSVPDRAHFCYRFGTTL